MACVHTRVTFCCKFTATSARRRNVPTWIFRAHVLAVPVTFKFSNLSMTASLLPEMAYVIVSLVKKEVNNKRKVSP